MSPIRKLIIDCDPGIDDALALLLACASPEIELMAVTAVAGNRSVETTAANAGRVLNAAGRRGVPVFSGCARPLAHVSPRFNLIHGEDGLGGVSLSTGRIPDATHATDHIARTLYESEPDTLVIAAIGPMTNLALVEIKHPGLLKRARSLLVMGGAAFCPGNITPNAEFNFHADALAAHVVLNAGSNLHLFGLDVTSRAVMPEAWIESFADLDTRCARAAHDMMRAYAARDPWLHDACPIAYLLDPTLFTGESCCVSVDWRPGPSEGQTSAWRACDERRPHPPNAQVFTDVDGERLRALLHSRIASLP